ncbi:MAG TPA: hypothetical protein VG938_07205 [Verrucomicrobiae bacterium]|nr:hypothetical protein [Verrucomicrobiae bacterium]
MVTQTTNRSLPGRREYLLKSTLAIFDSAPLCLYSAMPANSYFEGIDEAVYRRAIERIVDDKPARTTARNRKRDSATIVDSTIQSEIRSLEAHFSFVHSIRSSDCHPKTLF